MMKTKRIHHKDKPAVTGQVCPITVCDRCGKDFVWRSRLERHQRSHTARDVRENKARQIAVRLAHPEYAEWDALAAKVRAHIANVTKA